MTPSAGSDAPQARKRYNSSMSNEDDMTDIPTTGDAGREITSYPVRDFIDAVTMKRDLSYSPVDLTNAMTDQASLFAHYGVLAANASHQTNVVSMLLESTEAAIYKLLRDAAAAAGEKVTEAQLEKTMARHPRVIDMKKALNAAKRVEATCKIATEAFRHRRDMLVQQGSTSREEMKGELSIAARNVRDDVQAAQRDAVAARIRNIGVPA